MSKNRIVIIDDHEIFIQGLSFLIGRENDFEVVGTALNFFDAEKLVKELQPDLAIGWRRRISLSYRCRTNGTILER